MSPEEENALLAAIPGEGTLFARIVRVLDAYRVGREEDRAALARLLPGTPRAQETARRCAVDGCAAVLGAGTAWEFCAAHICARGACRSRALPGERTCARHADERPVCRAAACVFSAESWDLPYCRLHKCEARDCAGGATGASRFCAAHRCLASDCGARRVGTGTRCERHTCSMPGCASEAAAGADRRCVAHRVSERYQAPPNRGWPAPGNTAALLQYERTVETLGRALSGVEPQPAPTPLRTIAPSPSQQPARPDPPPRGPEPPDAATRFTLLEID